MIRSSSAFSFHYGQDMVTMCVYCTRSRIYTISQRCYCCKVQSIVQSKVQSIVQSKVHSPGFIPTLLKAIESLKGLASQDSLQLPTVKLVCSRIKDEEGLLILWMTWERHMTSLEAETYQLEFRAADGSRTSAMLFSELLTDLVYISTTYQHLLKTRALRVMTKYG